MRQPVLSESHKWQNFRNGFLKLVEQIVTLIGQESFLGWWIVAPLRKDPVF